MDIYIGEKNTILKILHWLHRYFSKHLWKTLFHTWTIFKSIRYGARLTVTLRDQRHSMGNRKNRMKILVFTHCFIDKWLVVSVIYFLVDPWWLFFLLMTLNPFFMKQKCRIRKIVSIIKLVKYVTNFAYTFTVYVHVTECKSFDTFFFFFCLIYGDNKQCLKLGVKKINTKHEQSKHGPFKTRGSVRWVSSTDRSNRPCVFVVIGKTKRICIQLGD